MYRFTPSAVGCQPNRYYIKHLKIIIEDSLSPYYGFQLSGIFVEVYKLSITDINQIRPKNFGWIFLRFHPEMGGAMLIVQFLHLFL